VLGMVCSLYSQEQVEKLKGKIHIPDSSTVQILSTFDGAVLNGRMVEIGQRDITFESTVGTLKIEISKIKDVKEISKSSVVSGEYRFPNPHSTRLFFAPTGEMLKAGQAYFQDTYIFLIGGSFGLTNNITLGGGISILPGASEQLFYFTPKVGFELSKNMKVAVGTLLMGTTGSGDRMGIHYAVGTLGSADGGVTGGIGYGYAGSGVAHKPIFVLGAQKRVSRSFSLVTENWFPPDSDPFLSFGGRFFGENLAVDLALISPLGAGMKGFPFIPYVDFVVSFK
jgi:hypothetical protein